MTQLTPATFRTAFTEFKSTTAYPDPDIQYYLTLSYKMLVNPLRWGTVYDNGIALFVAHNLVLEAQNKAQAARGAPPGVSTGAVSGKTIGPVSVSYDTAAGLNLLGGHWNLTTYGTRFLQLARMIGTGGLQV